MPFYRQISCKLTIVMVDLQREFEESFTSTVDPAFSSFRGKGREPIG